MTPALARTNDRSLLRHLSLATLLLALSAAFTLAQAQPAGPMGMAGGGAHGAAHHRAGPGMAGDPMLSDRMLDAAGASADQKSRVREILKTAHDDLQKMHEGHRELHQQMLAVLAAPQIDATAAESVRQKLLQRHDSASKRRLQAMLDAGAVLTPEQRQKLAERARLRGDMMQRHLRERQAIEPRS